jgi:DNA-binding NarL/FixJ family response regulator
MARVLVVDDHELLAQTLRMTLIATGIDAATVTPGPLDGVLDEALALRPELVLLDLDLGEWGDTTPLIAPLCAAGIRVLVVTGVVDRLRVALALEQGAIGYVAKASGFDALLERASAALAAPTPLDLEPRLALLTELAQARLARAVTMAPFESLTEREQATLLELADGRSVTDIARAWFVSEATVRSHVRGVLTKLGAPSQLAAVATALRAGWLSRPAATA